MKKIFLFSLLVIFSTSSFGQKIYFSDSTNNWRFLGLSEGPGVLSSGLISLHFVGDSTFIGHTYRFIGADIYSGYFIREDTIAKKVYIYTPPDTSDIVLYDYNLVYGDTLATIGPYPSHDHIKSWVTGRDSTLINGKWYHIWYFHSGSMHSYDYTVIEGIGCINGLDFPVNSAFFYGNPSDQLLCFKNQGASFPLSKPVADNGVSSSYDFYFDNTSSCAVEVNPLSLKSSTTTVAPNPLTETSRIVFPRNISSGIVAIYNDLGQPVINLLFQNKDDLLIGDEIKIPGIYYYRVTDNEHGTVYSGKFLKR